MFILSMLFLVCGVALMLDTLITANGVVLELPPSGSPGAHKHRIVRTVYLSLGGLLALGGLAMLLSE